MNLNKEQALALLVNIDEYEFEYLVADLWERRGWETEVTQGSSDRGIDVIAEKQSPFHQKQLIQVKRYARDNTIGSPDVQQYSSLRQQEDNVDAVVIVTTGSFSQQAERTADDLNVKLIDGSDLYNITREEGAEDILEEYLDLGTHQETTQSPESQTSDASSVGSHQTAQTQDVESDSTGEEPAPPFKILKEVYHNEGWTKTKLSVKYSILAFIGTFIVYAVSAIIFGPFPEEVTFANRPLFSAVSIPAFLILAGAFFVFIVYASRDKAQLDKETGQATRRHPITLGVLTSFTAGIYPIYYLVMRNSKFEIEESVDEDGVSGSGEESVESSENIKPEDQVT